MIIPLPWQAIIPEWCFRNYRNAWTVKEYCSLFIDTGHSLWTITIIPLIKVYNIDSNFYALKGHSIFKSVCNSEASWTAPFGITYRQLQPKLFLPAGPSATKHGPNRAQVRSLIADAQTTWQGRKGCSPPTRKTKIPRELSHLGMEIKVWSKDLVKLLYISWPFHFQCFSCRFFGLQLAFSFAIM